MSRDKCGAAAVAGFMKIVSLLKPQNIKVVGALSVVRNSVGSNAYVSDELIVSRSKKIIRIGNTDAEGRMIMADVLCKVKYFNMIVLFLLFVFHLSRWRKLQLMPSIRIYSRLPPLQDMHVSQLAMAIQSVTKHFLYSEITTVIDFYHGKRETVIYRLLESPTFEVCFRARETGSVTLQNFEVLWVSRYQMAENGSW